MYGSIPSVPIQKIKQDRSIIHTCFVPGSLLVLAMYLLLWSGQNSKAHLPAPVFLKSQEVYILRHGESEANRYLEKSGTLQQLHCDYAPEDFVALRTIVIEDQSYPCQRFLDAVLTDNGINDAITASEFWEDKNPEDFILMTSPHRRSAATLLLSLREKDLSNLRVTVDIRLREIAYHKEMDCELPEDIPSHLKTYLISIIDNHFSNDKKIKAKHFVLNRWSFSLDSTLHHEQGCYSQNYVHLFKSLHASKPLFISAHSGMMRCIMNQIGDTFGNHEFDAMDNGQRLRCCLPDNGSIWHFRWQLEQMQFLAKNKGYDLKAYTQCDGAHAPAGVWQICQAWDKIRKENDL